MPQGVHWLVGVAPQLIPTWAFYAVPWLLAIAIAAATAHRFGLVRAFGLGLMTVPVWETLLGIIESFGPLLQGGLVLRSYSTYQLSSLYSYKLLADLGYLGVGFILFAGGRDWLRQTPQTLARRLVEVGFPMGIRRTPAPPRTLLGNRSEAQSSFIGLLAFPLLLLGTVGVSLATAGLQSLRQSDESSVFANMTLYHAVVISLAAAFGEELVYRGLLQTILTRVFGGTSTQPLVRGLAVGGAIFVQAVVFGFAHSGYATWIHVLLPTLFGLVAGVAAWRFGIWSAIVLHLVVDLYAFGAEVAGREPWIWGVINVLFLANLVLSAGWGIVWVVRRLSPPPSVA